MTVEIGVERPGAARAGPLFRRRSEARSLELLARVALRSVGAESVQVLVETAPASDELTMVAGAGSIDPPTPGETARRALASGRPATHDAREAGGEAVELAVPLVSRAGTRGVLLVRFRETATAAAEMREQLAELTELSARMLDHDQEAPAPEGETGGRSKPARVGYGHRLLGAFEELERLPALGHARDALLNALASGDGDVAGAVESDLGLTVHTMRAAAVGKRVPHDVSAAVAALGMDRLRELVEAVPVVDFFERIAGLGSPHEFRLHAIETRIAADRIARELGRTDAGAARAAGLLHDVGKLVLRHAYSGYPEAVYRDAETPDMRLAAERRELGIDHASVGGVLARRWRLSASIAEAIEHHHSPDATGLAAVLRLADLLATYLHARPIDPQALLDAARAAGLRPSQLRAVMFELPTSGSPRVAATESPLSPGQARVLRGLATGRTYKQIAADLGLATSTVRTHAHQAYTRLGVSDRAQAVLLATERGWL